MRLIVRPHSNVQVTLQILAALIDKCSRDLALFAPNVLNILTLVLASRDINFVEESVPTFEALCAHLEQATFTSDRAELKQYDDIVATYASFASRSSPSAARGKVTSLPQALRFRTAGLKALKSLVSSDSFGTYSEYLRVIMPSILEQLVSEDPKYLRFLLVRENASEQQEKDLALKRRLSIGGRRSTEVPRLGDPNDADPAAVSGTTADVDQRATEELGVLAIQSLRKIFDTDNRGQVRVATTVTLSFALSHASKTANEKRQESRSSSTSISELFETICRWTAVQGRFIILVTTMENLISSPILEEDLPRQLLLSQVVTRLLRSNINFIGLSVMDVLIGLIHHMLLLLQLGGNGSSIAPHPQQRDGMAPNESSSSSSEKLHPVVTEDVKTPSAWRVQLLEQLQQCVADLAMHIYYTEQVGDMVSALLVRLKPVVTSVSSSTTAIENPASTVDAIAESTTVQERPRADSFFSFDTARSVALQCVNEILITANSHRVDPGSAEIRSRVGVAVWEGTQWLLRDPDPTVRRAYLEALITWLDLEVDRNGLRLAEESIPDAKTSRRSQAHMADGPRRGVSNGSKQQKVKAKAHSSFMQLLHLAIYEQALAFADTESEILHLHLLLATLVQRLGINSVRSGLPMMFQLQEDGKSLTNPTAVVLITSLVHAYFMVLSRAFDFEATGLGRQIQNEMSRRASLGLWATNITIQPMPLARLDSSTPSFATASAIGNPPAESLKFVESREEMADCISDGYSQSLASPPSSPLVTPGRPTHRMRSLRSSVSSAQVPVIDGGLPANVKLELLEHWSREACLQAAELERSQTLSVSGSKNESGSGQRSHGSPDDHTADANAVREPTNNNFRASAYGTGGRTSLRAAHGSFPGKRYISPGSMGTPASNSSARSVMKVDDLKRALSGNYTPRPFGQSDGMTEDTASDSLVSGDFTASELSLPTHTNGHETPSSLQQQAHGFMREAEPLHHSTPPPDDDIPPVPQLPASLRSLHGGADHAAKLGGDAAYGSESPIPSQGRIVSGKFDLQALLRDTQSTPPPKFRASTVGTPPY